MTETAPINFTRGVPANESYPIAELVDAASTVLGQRGVEILQYGPARGYTPLREWIATWQKADTDEVMVANGSLQFIDFLCQALLRPGDVVFTETPTYDRTLTLLHRHHVTVVGIPLQADGPDMDALEAALRRQHPRMFYLIPDFQNPTGATCSGDKRRQIAKLAAQHNFLLLEDAPYRLLRYRGRSEPTLRELAPEQTLHMSSFTKLIAPGVRIGFMIGNRELLAQAARVAEDTYISPGYLAEGIADEWCRRGLLEPQIERLKALYAPRLDACLRAIDEEMPEAESTRPDGGFFLSLTLPEGFSNNAVRAAATKRGLNLSDGRAFFPDGGGERFLRLPFCALSQEEIREGIRRLAAALADVRAR
jgi:DNA-binding transcriptional MocR family regulator